MSILQHLVSSYKLWHELKLQLPKSGRYTLGEKVDALFMVTLELIFSAQYLKKDQRLPALQQAAIKFDALKFFLQLLWETKDLSTKHYELLSRSLAEIGKMLGGWLRRLEADAARPGQNRDVRH